MPTIARQVYIISDLHIGGRYPEGVDLAAGIWPDRNDRGFRICTRVDAMAEFVRWLAGKPADGPAIELVINGDFVDFLAEEWEGPEPWKAFIDDPEAAADRLDAIIERDRIFFDALAEFLSRGHRLTVLLGNHDVELSFARVRQRLENALGVQHGKKFAFLYDGEAYVVGDAVIEHGNRYDGFNVTDHDGLRRVRSIQTRREKLRPEHDFRRPPGSKLVAHVMNQLKTRYPFIDLLKPEDSGALPIVLALAPAAYTVLARLGLARDVAGFAAEASRYNPSPTSQPTHAGDISSAGGASAAGDFDDMFAGDISAGEPVGQSGSSGMDDGMQELLAEALGKDAAQAFSKEIVAAAPVASPAQEAMDDEIDVAGDISAGSFVRDVAAKASQALNVAKLLFARETRPLTDRIDAVYQAVRAVQNDRSFDRSIETKSEYRKAAEALLGHGYKYVVFGHTHLAKRVELDGGVYLNSGTWADLMRFPGDILEKPAAEARTALTEFVQALAERRFARYVEFMPTYVQLDLAGDDRVVTAELHDYRPAKSGA